MKILSWFNTHSLFDLKCDGGGDVVDEGGFLHAVTWKPLAVSVEVLQQYVSYADRHYGPNTIFVFDGYNGPSTKITNISKFQWAHHLNALMLKSMFIYKHQKVSMQSNEMNKMSFID